MKLFEEIRAHLPSTKKPKGWYVADLLLEKAANRLEELESTIEMSKLCSQPLYSLEDVEELARAKKRIAKLEGICWHCHNHHYVGRVDERDIKLALRCILETK